MDAERARALFRQMSVEIHDYAARRSSLDVADEVLAETFLALWAGRHRVPSGHDEQRAWIYGIARFQLVSVQRRERRHLRLGVRAAAALLSGVPVVEADSAVIVEDADQAVRCHRGLSPRDQEIIQLVNWEGLSPTEVAVVLDVAETVVRARLSRARRRLAGLLRLDDMTSGIDVMGPSPRASSPRRRIADHGQESS